MSDPDTALRQEDIEAPMLSTNAMAAAITELKQRCATANIAINDVSEIPGEQPAFRLGMKCCRDLRSLYIPADKSLIKLLSVSFENYVFLSGFDAICSYSDDIIEAAVRPLDALRFSPLVRRFASALEFVLEPPRSGFPKIELGRASDCFVTLMRTRVWTTRLLTLKISGSGISTHDQALAQLKRTADAVFFQIDLLSDTALALIRERQRALRRPRKEPSLASDLQYPPTEFDEAPISLYWYGRSASGMPLLQFLAFYQVIEFYFPIYSQAEAQRKLKVILKDPTFRGDRDADIGRLLSAITVSRSGAYGDERSQLRATLMECTNQDALRDFLCSDPQRLEFYSKARTHHRIPVVNPSADLRGDVADRIYDICAGH
jgi:hypothetical protein